MDSSREDYDDDDTVENFSFLQSEVSTLNLTFQEKFWRWFSNNLQKFRNKDTSELYDVMLASNPNPLSSPAMAEGAGALAIIGRVARLFVVPLQKILQYYEWANAPEGSEAKKKKPTFTRQDAFYLGLDIVLLGLTAAAFFAGASIPGSAIALTAACISFGVAAYQYGNYWYEGYKLNKEKQHVDALREKLSANPDTLLNENDHQFIQTQRQQLGADNNLPVLEVLDKRSATLAERIKLSISNRYQNIKKSIGFSLTMLGIVSASMILAGLVLGPVGVPLIMAGAGLSIATLIIAGSMMAANAIKEKRDEKQKKIAVQTLQPGSDEKKPDELNHLTQKLSAKLTASSLQKRKQAAAAEKIAENEGDIELTNLQTPYMQSDSSVVKASIFNHTVTSGEPVVPNKHKPPKTNR